MVRGRLSRWLAGIPAHLAQRDALASTDGARIRLPRRLDRDTEPETLALYRLLALEQAARATRGTPRFLPAEPALRDLYLLSEATAIDRWIAAEVPGLRAALIDERQRLHAAWPGLPRLNGPERVLQGWLLAALGADPERPPAPIRLADDPAASLAWAEHQRAALGDAHRYRGLPAVALWGRVERPPRGHRASEDDAETPDEASSPMQRIRALLRRPEVREAPDDEDDDRPGMSMVPTQDRMEKAEDPMGLNRPTDRDDDADLDDLAESLEELPEARLVRTKALPREVLASDDPPEVHPGRVEDGARRVGLTYPEWDHRSGAYRLDHVVVWCPAPEEASDARVAALVRRNAPVVHGVRRRFERLQPRRVRKGRQKDGPEIDLDAYVASFADQRASGPVEDRLYAIQRPLRRELAIALLVDASGSTDAWVSAQQRVVDVERDALLIVAEALDALGDRYAILTFSGNGPRGVQVTHLKDYDERYGALVRRRIAGLEPQHFTRLGAALRHATAGLARERVAHRMLLVLSDGKPNDLDEYEGRYGVEDARQAVAEARLQHIHPFCLTVDRQAPAYIARIFGPTGYATLREATALPRVLVDVVRHLIQA